MSVCIAAITKQGSNNDIVAIVDRKVASGEFSNEDATLKSKWVGPDWICMFAGNDISPVVPIVNRVIELIGGDDCTLKSVAGAFKISYQEYLSNLCHAQVLGRWKFRDVEEFREKGRKQFGADVFDTLCHQIEQIKIRCTFLVCGIGADDDDPHIFTVSHPGVIEIRDTPGYWAIGNGAFAAMSLLSFFRQSVICSLERTFYQVITAKLMAETASDVGAIPFCWRLQKDGGAGNVPSEMFTDVKEAWQGGGCPIIPDGILEKITGHLNEPRNAADRKSEPETSEPEQ